MRKSTKHLFEKKGALLSASLLPLEMRKVGLKSGKMNYVCPSIHTLKERGKSGAVRINRCLVAVFLSSTGPAF